MKNKSYNFWFALLYEITLALGTQYPVLKKARCYWFVLNKTKPNWLFWRVKNDLIMLDNNLVASEYFGRKRHNPKS